MPHYDVIVLGLGGMGSAAAYRLAQRGQRVLGLDPHGLVLGGGGLARLVPPHVAALGPLDVPAGAAHHEHLLDRLAAAGERLVDRGLERHRLAAAELAVRRDDHAGLGVLAGQDSPPHRQHRFRRS